MNKTNNCSVCGGLVAPYDYVCDFCGNVIFENIKTTENIEQGTLSFEDGMAIVQENLNAMHDIPKPTLNKAITAALRVLVALYTLGIVLIFWRRPKKRFNYDIYSKLRNITLRNISFLKISSKGSSDLMNRIKVYEDELNTVEKAVKQGKLQKNIALISVLALYVVWFAYIANKPPKTHAQYQAWPLDTVAQGNIGQHIIIVPDSSIITYSKPGDGYDWQMDVKLKLKQLDSLANKKTKYEVKLEIVDKNGIKIEGFESAELSKSSKQTFKENISRSDSRTNFYRFTLSHTYEHPDYRDTLPFEAIKYIIIADTILSK